MRTRALTTLLLAAVVAGGWLMGTGASQDDGGRTYWVVFDNAFGLIEGADVKVSGVRAGSIKSMELDRSDLRARVEIEVTEDGFGSLRTDTTCETRPQSLIGEYFVDCRPGEAAEELAPGSTIPVQRTASTVPVDLVNDIMRRPYRERFSILLSELGAGLAARGDDLDATIRRAVPALRETDRVLALLAQQRRTIRDLNRDADTVLAALAGDREDIARFVREARDTAAATADRQEDLRAQFRRLPTFLAELRPTMRLLGTAADRQRPALAALRSEAGRLTRLLDVLGDFSEASRPAFRTLAATARGGRPAVVSARPQVRRLGRAVKELPEVSQNLALVLEDLDDPSRAVEDDPRNPRGTGGYTGLESLLRYIHYQGQATNVYDGDGYMLKVSAFVDADCAFYWDAERAKTDPAWERCSTKLGPNQIGITHPDPTATSEATTREAPREQREDGPGETPGAPAPAPAPGTPAPVPAPTAPQTDRPGFLEDVLDGLVPEGLVPDGLDGLDGLLGGERRPGGAPDAGAGPLLDYLLGG